MRRKLLLVLIVALALAATIAVPPAAGTQIKNQAAATYIDNSGVERTILSNQVITTVLPVYSVLVTPDVIEQPAAAGQTLNFQFRIDNLANTSDSFNATPVIDDVNSTFLPITPEVYYDENANGLVDPGEVLWNTGIVIPSNDFRYAIVRYRVPSATTAGATATVWLNVDSASDPVSAYDYNNAANATVYNDAVINLYKSVVPQDVSAGDTVTYVISGNNSGNKSAYNIKITDILDGNLTFVSSADTRLEHAAGTITITISELSPANQFRVEFQVRINADTQSGMIENIATMQYDTSTSGSVSRSSNVSTIMVGGPGYETTMVWIGPSGDPRALVETTDRSTESGVAGTLVSFVNTVENAGLSVDVIDVTVDEIIPADLEGVVAIAFFAENLTPLPDSNNNGMQDSGPLAPGDTFDVVVKVFVPSSISTVDASITAIVRAISSISSLASDTTLDIVHPITTPEIAIGNASETALDDIYDKTPVNLTGDPGAYVYFPLDVVNESQGSDTFTLSAVTPAGWTVRFHIDENGDGILDPEEMSSVTNTGEIGPNAGKRIIARVLIPEGTLWTGTPVPVKFHATSLHNPTVSDYQENSITVNKVYSILLQPSRNGSAAPNSHIDYEHTLTNTGNVAVTVMLYPDSSRNWSYVFEVGGNTVPLDSAFPLEPGQSITGIFRLFVPGEPLGVIDVSTLKAVVQEDTSVTAKIIDVTVVVSANIRISKTVDKTEAEPGEVLIYTVSYSNIGTEPVASFTVYDSIPFYTKLHESITDGTFSPLPTGVSYDFGATWETFADAVFGDVTTLRWELSTLDAGESGTVSFPVVIDGYDN